MQKLLPDFWRAQAEATRRWGRWATCCPSANGGDQTVTE